MKRHDNKHVFNKFEYHTEDLDCEFCLHRTKCKKKACRYEEIRREAVKHGRFKRTPGWFSPKWETW
jgi:hypothetical protein